MSDRDYSNREINSLFEKHGFEHKAFAKQLSTILEQTTKHNGRLTRLERVIWTLGGAISVFGLLEFDKIVKLFT